MQRREFLALPLAGLAACTRPRRTTTIRAAAPPNLGLAPLYVAHEQGYFKEEGLALEIQQVRFSREAVPLMAGGKIDVAFYALNSAVMNAIARGARVRVVAGRQKYSTRCSDQQVLFGTRMAFPSGFHDLRQLKGKRIGVYNSEVHDRFVLNAALAAGGLTSSDVKIVKMAEHEVTILTAAGKADVLTHTMDNPNFYGMGGRFVTGPALSSFLPDHMFSFMLYGRHFLDEDRESGIRFLRAFLRGVRAFAGGMNPRFLGIVSQQEGMDPKLATGICRGRFVVDGHVDLPSLQQVLDYALTENVLQHPLSAAQVVDLGFLQELQATGNRKAAQRPS